MLLIEVHVPRGVLSEEERQALAHRIIHGVLDEPGAHAPEILDTQRELTQVLFHEPAAWVLGQRSAADPADPPRYVVRVTVPASWRKDVSAHVVEAVSAALAETERAAGRDAERVHRAPHATVLVDGVPEGGVGLFGRVRSTMDLTELVSRPYRDRTATEPPATPVPGTLVDPICGMTVYLDDAPLTLTHAGTLYGFCHGLCRRAFADEHGVPLGE